MIIYKFGGSSIKDTLGIRNLCEIVAEVREPLVLVVSALGKTTNDLEALARIAWGDDSGIEGVLNKIRIFHFTIIDILFEKDSKLKSDLTLYFKELSSSLENKGQDFDAFYDRVVSWGEILSSKIIHTYLLKLGVLNKWLDVTNLIITDENFREARINWVKTTENVTHAIDDKENTIYITQGFIGGTKDGNPTTLGREGSDFTAAILGNILDARSVVIWKDVPGILNADPHHYKDAVLFPEISYQEAIELAFFGAKVIHPKTIKPLQNKNIPLEVRSFSQPNEKGTLIRTDRLPELKIPSYIFKQEQALLSLSPRDFSFAVDDCLGQIFSALNSKKIRVNLIQNSAISLSVCVDQDVKKLEGLIDQLHEEFQILYNKDVTLITIRHYTSEAISRAVQGEILIEQRTRNTVHFVVKKS